MTDTVTHIDVNIEPAPRIDGHGQLTLPGTPAPAAALDDAELVCLVEALLLVAPEPPSLDELAAGASVEAGRIEAALALLMQDEHRGWVITRHDDRVQLATAPRFASQIRTFLGLDREARLSSAALETLAIVAYRQPVTRSEIEAIRGVDASGVLSTLHGRGLIETVSRRNTVGNPHQYTTTAEFLRHFGIRELSDLPPLGQIEGEDGIELLRSAATPVSDQVIQVQPESPASRSD